MASVTPSYVWTGTTDPITYQKLNLTAQPVVTVGTNEIVTSMIADNSVTVAKLAQATGGGFLGRTASTLGNISFVQLSDGGITWPTYGLAISKASSTTEFNVGESDTKRFRLQYNSAFPSGALKISVSDTGDSSQDYGAGPTDWVGGTFTYSIGNGSSGSQEAIRMFLNGGSPLIWTPSVLCTGGTNGFGFLSGAGVGGTVTQATSKSTGVTLSKQTGQITMNAAALASDTTVSFVLTNTMIAATDFLGMNHISGGTPGSYLLNAQCAAGSATINVRNITAGSLSEAIVIQFVLIKGATS